jgi:hypothetical protein
MFAKAASDGWQQHAQEGLAILKRLDAEGKLTADQKGWIEAFEAALQTADKPTP